MPRCPFPNPNPHPFYARSLLCGRLTIAGGLQASLPLGHVRHAGNTSTSQAEEEVSQHDSHLTRQSKRGPPSRNKDTCPQPGHRLRPCSLHTPRTGHVPPTGLIPPSSTHGLTKGASKPLTLIQRPHGCTFPQCGAKHRNPNPQNAFPFPSHARLRYPRPVRASPAGAGIPFPPSAL